ncbi:conserved Plasmodium protein, unknown function [Plasmodium ovale]|uniref:Uncharacterized protein n=2 Tax=Plasmodium ovale TaxID=36330 RepID=A0A1A8WWF2_PLAOA|nr:hypothetical protein POVCU2_0040140 [Plasmodium ovale curtisi]SBS97295.1 hypothetical protein POVCU1_037040 [Plasmodium ovale curtisi]SCP05958.1 conserved Plasmodium protein, unknown function [Plasmodium ovale]
MKTLTTPGTTILVQFHYVTLVIESQRLKRYLIDCRKNMKEKCVKIVARDHAISCAFTLLERMRREFQQLKHFIKYRNLEDKGVDRRKILEVNIYLLLVS